MNQRRVAYYVLNTNYHQISMTSIAFRLTRFVDAFSRRQSGMRLRESLSEKIAATSEEEPSDGYRLYYKIPDNHIAWTRGDNETGEPPKQWPDVHLLALTQHQAKQLCGGHQVYTQWFPFGLHILINDVVGIFLGSAPERTQSNPWPHQLPSPSNEAQFALRPQGFSLSNDQSMLPYDLEGRLQIDLKSVFVNKNIADQLRTVAALPTVPSFAIKPHTLRTGVENITISELDNEYVEDDTSGVGEGVKVLIHAAKLIGAAPGFSGLQNIDGQTPLLRQRENRIIYLMTNSPGTLFGKERARRAMPLIELHHNRSRGTQRSDLNIRLIDEIKRQGKHTQPSFMSNALFLTREASRHWQRWQQWSSRSEELPNGCNTKDEALYDLLTTYGFSGKSELKTLFAIITWNGASYRHPPFK